MKHLFKFYIGDRGGDGHEQTESFTIQTNKPEKAVYKAYEAAKKKISREIHPENFLNEGEENELSNKLSILIEEEGGPLPEDPTFVEPIYMANYIVWFLNQGDKDLGAILIHDDVKELSLGSTIGYGLFGN